jgi:hypothetical protein
MGKGKRGSHVFAFSPLAPCMGIRGWGSEVLEKTNIPYLHAIHDILSITSMMNKQFLRQAPIAIERGKRAETHNP